MRQELWKTLPTKQKKALEEVLNSSKNLTNSSINQLIEKLENNQAADWTQVLSEYNAIPGVKNIDTSQMQNRAQSVSNKFNERGYSQLQDREFEPRELLSLVILCYSNPNLIGPNICKALNDQNDTDIKKEMLENSARVGTKVAPWASNLRLLNGGFYFDDSNIILPDSIITRVTSEANEDGREVIILDGNSTKIINAPSSTDRGITSRKRDVSETVSTEVLLSTEVLRSTQPNQLLEGGGFAPKYNAAAGVNLNPMLIMVVTALAFAKHAKHIPIISSVMGNIIKDIKDATVFCCSKAEGLTFRFFSGVKPMQPSKEERLEEQQPIFKTGL